MPRPTEARVWWAEVDDVRERIERRRARGEAGPPHREVRVIRPDARSSALHLVAADTRHAANAARGAYSRAGAPGTRRRPRPRPAELLGPRPDRIAAWAVALGFLLVLAAILSAH